MEAGSCRLEAGGRRVIRQKAGGGFIETLESGEQVAFDESDAGGQAVAGGVAAGNGQGGGEISAAVRAACGQVDAQGNDDAARAGANIQDALCARRAGQVHQQLGLGARHEHVGVHFRTPTRKTRAGPSGKPAARPRPRATGACRMRRPAARSSRLSGYASNRSRVTPSTCASSAWAVRAAIVQSGQPGSPAGRRRAGQASSGPARRSIIIAAGRAGRLHRPAQLFGLVARDQLVNEEVDVPVEHRRRGHRTIRRCGDR